MYLLYVGGRAVSQPFSLSLSVDTALTELCMCCLVTCHEGKKGRKVGMVMHHLPLLPEDEAAKASVYTSPGPFLSG